MAEKAARSSLTGMDWTYKTTELGEGIVTAIYDGNSRMVAIHVEESMAARIVNAVNCYDKLLEALQECLKDAEGYARTNGAGGDATLRIKERCDKARAAIARATRAGPALDTTAST